MIKRFFEWLYFNKPTFEAGAYCKRRIVKIKGIGLNGITFYVAVYAGIYETPFMHETITKHWRIRNIFRLVMRAFRIGRGAPYKGICAHCGTKVYHYYPWFTKNPKEDSAKPLHEECARIYLFNT